MSKYKFYAIKLPDGSSHIVEGWKNCEARVKNVSNILYKGFINYSDAKKWLDGIIEDGIYTDAAANKDDVVWGAAAYINGILHYIYGERVIDKKYARMGSTGGELSAILAMIPYAVNANIKIIHDYEGAVKLLNGDMQPRTEGTRDFVKRMKLLKKEYQLEEYPLLWVPSHSGEQGNELVDEIVKNMLRRTGKKEE